MMAQNYGIMEVLLADHNMQPLTKAKQPKV